MIDRYGSMRQPMGLRQLMDRLMEDAFIMPREGGSQGWGGPAMDVFEENDNLIVEAHLPGLKPEDLEVHVERGMLTISGRAEAEEERKDRNYLVREKRMGRFTRSLQLPPSYNTENCQSHYEHGVLRLVFPKAEEAKPRRIQIGTGAQRSGDGQPGSAPQFETAGGVSRKPEDRA
jgi:HSP20 family protein